MFLLGCVAAITATTLGGVVILWRSISDGDNKSEDKSENSSYERPDWMDNDDLTRSL